MLGGLRSFATLGTCVSPVLVRSLQEDRSSLTASRTVLNAEWNKPKDREVHLHRHPAFFGRAADVIEDCCGTCPKPVTPEEIEVAEKEAETNISGKLTFMTDNPGRQQIGSFNPLTDDDWTDMAYVGNTARLCQSIVDADLDEILDWLAQEGADINQRDYTGRTPLHLAVISSTSEVVRCLVDHGARLTARLADGMTALHLAAERGNVEMVKVLLDKSTANEADEEEKQDRRQKAIREAAKESSSSTSEEQPPRLGSDQEDSDGDLIEDREFEFDLHSVTTGSFVKVNAAAAKETQSDPELDESQDTPDFYTADVLAWDTPCSPLHLAIAEGHEDVVELLCDVSLTFRMLSPSPADHSAVRERLPPARQVPGRQQATEGRDPDP